MVTTKHYISGLCATSLKKHPAVIPLLFFAGVGAGLAAFYTWRLAVKSPEVSWNRKGKPEPWNDYDGKQYKFLAVGRDYSEPSPVPKYK